jgi:hypothetical protein
MIVGYGVEGSTDAPVAEHLIRLVGRVPRTLSDSGGSTVLDQKVKKWNQSSLTFPILVLRDWDDTDDVSCAPELVTKVLGGDAATAHLVVRIAVRSIESWLLADRDAFAKYFGTTRIPKQPDQELNPKAALVSACRSSKKKPIRDAVVPKQTSGRQVGPLYAPTIIDFAANAWDANRAARNSPSLARAIARLLLLAKHGTI